MIRHKQEEIVLFVQHKQLKRLNVAVEKIAHLHAATGSVQLAFSGFPPQLCQAYLLQVVGGAKILVVVAFYLTESQSSIFFVPKYGEVPSSDVENVYEEGYSFVESMGFVLNETDFHLLPADKKKTYWQALPICQAPQNNGSDMSKGRTDSREIQQARRKNYKG